jgi:hypothetical protein
MSVHALPSVYPIFIGAHARGLEMSTTPRLRAERLTPRTFRNLRVGLRIEVDYRSEVRRTKRKEVSRFCFTYIHSKNRNFADFWRLPNPPLILFLEELNV